MLSLPEHAQEWTTVLRAAQFRGWVPDTLLQRCQLVDARVLEAGATVPPSPPGAVVYVTEPSAEQLRLGMGRWKGFRVSLRREELYERAGWEHLANAVDPHSARRRVQVTLTPYVAGTTPLAEAQRLLLSELHRGSIKQIAALKYSGADPAHTFAKVFTREGRTSPRIVLYALQCAVYAFARERGFSASEAAEALGTTSTLWKRTLQQTLRLSPERLGQIPSVQWLQLSRALLDGGQQCTRASQLEALVGPVPMYARGEVR